MTARVFIYQTMNSSTELAPIIGGPDNPRIFAKKSMTSAQEEHPFIVYKLGYSTDTGITGEDDDIDLIENQFVQIWIHDYTDTKSGDYMRIDEVIAILKKIFKNASSPEDGVFAMQYLETSQDLNDETLNTVFKYVRFQLKKEGQ